MINHHSRTYHSLDCFRLVAAFLVVAIHTYPLSDISPELNFAFVHVFARIAVPFFLMVTGFFVCRGPQLPLDFIKKTLLIYAGATLIYLPVSIYAGHYANVDIFSTAIKNILFDGTFYHLWYLPAVVIGLLIYQALSRKCPPGVVLGVVLILYALGLLGDSYHGMTMRIPYLSDAYEWGFCLFSHTRNGLFFAPLFIAMGAAAGRGRPLPLRWALPGFIMSMALMLAEGFALRQCGWPRHDSMYVTLIACMFFLFQFLLAVDAHEPGLRLRAAQDGCVKLPRKDISLLFRGLALWIFILHPLVIIGLRGLASVADLTPWLVENRLIHYLAVCLLSAVAAILTLKIIKLVKTADIAPICKLRKTINMAIYTTWRNAVRPSPSPTGRAWLELDMANLRHNVAVLRDTLPPHCSLMACVKADAYGHGALVVCRELYRLGIRAFCVASVAEGVALRKGRIKGEILVLGYTHPTDFPQLRHYRLSQSVMDHEYAALLAAFGHKLPVHVEIDTGMRRAGERAENIGHIMDIFAHENLDVRGIYTHFATADGKGEADRAFTQLQARRFRDVLDALAKNGHPLPTVHSLSSYGVFGRRHEPDSSDSDSLARIGLGLYGTLSNSGDAVQWQARIKPVLSVKARVGMVKSVLASESVGYGLDFTAPQDMRIAIIGIGYADGLPRSLGNGIGQVIIGGRKVPIVGRVCMDSISVDVSDIPDICSGDVAVIIGKDGAEEISACDVAGQAGTIANEILSRLGPRLGRVALHGSGQKGGGQKKQLDTAHDMC